MKLTRAIFLVLGALLAASGFADEHLRSDVGHLDGLSLLDAYQAAREIDPALAIAGFRVDGALAKRDVARGNLFPKISLFGEWSENTVRYERTAISQLPAQEYPGERYGMQLRSPLLNLRSYRELQRQTALVDESKENLSMAEAEILSIVAQIYLSSLLAAENLEQLKTELAALERQLEEASALYEKDLLPVTQVLEIQSRTDSLRADLVDARGQVAITREKLAQLMGFIDFELMEVSERVNLSARVESADMAAALAAQFDPATAAATQALNAARKGVEREKSSWWPEIDFVYNSQYSDVGFDNLTSPPRSSETFAVSVRYPLFEGGSGAARIRGAWAEFYAAQYQLEAVRRTASARARTAWVNLEIASERVQASRQAVRTAEVALDASRKAVRAGTARITDVLLALAQSSRAKRDLNESRFQRALSWLELELSTGSEPGVLAAELSDGLHGR